MKTFFVTAFLLLTILGAHAEIEPCKAKNVALKIAHQVLRDKLFLTHVKQISVDVHLGKYDCRFDDVNEPMDAFGDYSVRLEFTALNGSQELHQYKCRIAMTIFMEVYKKLESGLILEQKVNEYLVVARTFSPECQLEANL